MSFAHSTLYHRLHTPNAFAEEVAVVSFGAETFGLFVLISSALGADDGGALLVDHAVAAERRSRIALSVHLNRLARRASCRRIVTIIITIQSFFTPRLYLPLGQHMVSV